MDQVSSSGELVMVFVLGKVQLTLTHTLSTHCILTVIYGNPPPPRGHCGVSVGSWEVGYSSDKKYIERRILRGMLAFWP